MQRKTFAAANSALLDFPAENRISLRAIETKSLKNFFLIVQNVYNSKLPKRKALVGTLFADFFSDIKGLAMTLFNNLVVNRKSVHYLDGSEDINHAHVGHFMTDFGGIIYIFEVHLYRGNSTRCRNAGSPAPKGDRCLPSGENILCDCI